MAVIKNIIFDLGGVLYKIDYDKTFVQLGILLGHDLTVGQWPDWFKLLVFKYETGKISTEGFLLGLQMKSLSKPVPQGNDLVKAWNSMLIGWEDQVFDMLEYLYQEYNLFILSNINPLHAQQLEYSLSKMNGITGLSKWIKGIYFSHLMGMRKPESGCFEVIIRENNLLPGETLFVDDYPKNILGAQEIGLQCVVHNPNENIYKKIKKYTELVC